MSQSHWLPSTCTSWRRSLTDRANSGTLTLRRMVQADLEQVIAINQRSFSLPWPDSSFDYELNDNEASRCWVAELESDGSRKVVAMAVIWFIIDEVHIATIAVDPDYRSRKIGQKLLTAILKDAAKSGAKLAFLEVRDSNTAARALYRKFGFQEVGVRPHYYGDNFEDAIMMNLDPIDEAVLERLD